MANAAVRGLLRRADRALAARRAARSSSGVGGAARRDRSGWSVDLEQALAETDNLAAARSDLVR
jgi:hypothetical protein